MRQRLLDPVDRRDWDPDMDGRLGSLDRRQVAIWELFRCAVSGFNVAVSGVSVI